MDASSTVAVDFSHNAAARIGQRVLIVRLSAFGDVIHGLPVLCALRKSSPDAFLAWVVEGRSGDLLEGHPALDALIRLPRGWLKSPTTVARLRRALRQMSLDAAVDLQCLTKSAIAAWLSGAKRRIGVAGSDGRELSKWFHNELINVDAPHVIEHYLQIAQPLCEGRPDGAVGSVEFRLPETSADARFAESTLSGAGFSGREFAILNPGAGWPSKRWPADRYGTVAVHLGSQHGVPAVVVWAGDAERNLANEIVRKSDNTAVLAPPTSIKQLAALCRRACLFVGSDTGPLHLAVAVGTPSISMHGPSRAEWCGAYGAANCRIQARYEEGTSKQRRRADNRAMREITAASVCDACDQLLEASNRSKRPA